MRLIVSLIVALVCAAASHSSEAQQIGVVVMHGKGGSPTGYVSDLASTLAEKGYLVANLEMPWSGKRNYDANVDAAQNEVQAALDTLRARGAKSFFIAGHSQGALFALYFAGKRPVDGVIAIAPGGSVNRRVLREHLGESLERARKLVAEGKGGEPTRLMDHEGSRGTYPVITTPAAYVSWFDPEGAMNLEKALTAVKPQTAVLYIVPQRDYASLLKFKQPNFNMLPRNPLTRLYEPDSDHRGALAASREEIVRWTVEVARSPRGAYGT